MAHRKIVDSDQLVWTVWAVHDSRSIPGRRVRPELAQGWLAFQSRAERRRLSPVPDGWLQLTDAELERLCCEATPAPYNLPAGVAKED